MKEKLNTIIDGSSATQKTLNEFYQKFFYAKSIPQALGTRMSCPLLISASSEWDNASRKLLVIGQETKHWGPDFSGDYNPADQTPLHSLSDFLGDSKNINRLVDWYKEFNLSTFYPKLSRTPFWQAFKQLSKQVDSVGQGATLWANLFLCDVDGESPRTKLTVTEISEVLDFQKYLLAQTIAILRPTHVVFLTGPYYDDIIKSEFTDTYFEACLENVTSRQFSHVRALGLPENTFRTYHPNYLSRAKLWSLLDSAC